MGSRAGTKLLTTGTYLTDDKQLVYVLDLPEPDQAVIEDAATGNVSCMLAEKLIGWRIVEPSNG